MFSRQTKRRDTSLPGANGTLRSTSRTRAAGAGFELLNDNKQQTSFGDGNDQQRLVLCHRDEGLQDNRGMESRGVDVELGSINRSIHVERGCYVSSEAKMG